MRFKNDHLLIFVLFVVVLAFWPSLFNGFIKNDDPTHLLDNVTLRALTWDHVHAMFNSIVNVTYIPLTTLSFAIEYHFCGYNPFVYHLNNLLLHLAVTALVYFFLRRLGLSHVAAAISALIFGTHPLRVESVAWVTERKDVLYSVFYLLAVNWYWDYVKSRKSAFYVLSIAGAALSILAKPMALSLPLVLLLCDWWAKRPWERKIFLEKIPFFLAVVPVAAVTYLLNARNPVQDAGEALMFWVWCFIFYIRKFILPLDLNIFYQFPRPVSWANPEYALSAAAFVSLLFLVWYFRKQRLLVFAVLFYFVSIFFLLRFDDMPNINPVSDRFMYLPSVGFCALLGFWSAQFWERPCPVWRRRLGIGIAGVGLITLGVLTHQYCRVWRDGTQLWSAVIRHSPSLALAYVHRGAEHHMRGQLPEAIRDYQSAIAISDDAYAHSNLAVIYREQKKYDEALGEYGRAVALKPDYWGWYYDRANLYLEMQKYELAISDYTKTLQLLPGYSQAYTNRGLTHSKLGDDDRALADYHWAVRFDPRNVNAINNRAVLMIKRNEFEQAIRDFSLSIRLDPANPGVYFNRGLAYRDTAQYHKALRDFEKALQVDPEYQPAYLAKLEVERILRRAKRAQ